MSGTLYLYLKRIRKENISLKKMLTGILNLNKQKKGHEPCLHNKEL